MKLRNLTAAISLLLLTATIAATAATLPAIAETPEPVVSYITITAVEPIVSAASDPLPMAGESFSGRGENDMLYTQQDVEAVARAVYGEARGTSPEEQRLVVWTVLQRLDDPRWPDSITGVVTQPGQFQGYDPTHPLDETILALCEQEMAKWAAGEPPPVFEQWVTSSSGRYYYFDSIGSRNNFFREEWK